MPVNAVAALLVAHLIIRHYGPSLYALYGLLAAVGSMLPFADLGVSAAVMNAVAESPDPSTDERVYRTLVAAIRVLMVSATCILALDLLITLLGGWPSLLGRGLGGSKGDAISAAVCGALIALGLPFAFGQRVLIGLRKNHVSLLVGALQWPITLLLTLVFIRSRLVAPALVASLPYLAAALVATCCAVVASGWIRPQVRKALLAIPKLREERGAPILRVAWPMLAQMIALPIAMQSDRIVLSHVSSSAAVAQYTLASQFFLPIWTLIDATGIALWPIFAEARARPDVPALSPYVVSLTFGAGACALSGAVVALSPLLTHVVAGHDIHLAPLLLASFALLSVLQAVKYPLGMYLTDAHGLTYQAIMISLFLPVNLGISILLASSLGAAGPVIGSVIGVFCCQVVANWLYIRRRTVVAPFPQTMIDGTAPEACPSAGVSSRTQASEEDRAVRVARVYRIARSAHFERLRTLTPGDQFYVQAGYDFDPATIPPGCKVVRASPIRIIWRLLASRYEVVEINEPMMISNWLFALSFILVSRCANTFTDREPIRIVAYCIENLDPSRVLSARVPITKFGAFLVTAAFVNIVARSMERLTFGTQESRELYRSYIGRSRVFKMAKTIHALPSPCLCPEPLATLRDRDDRTRILFLGTFDGRKGLEQLLTAWPLVTSREPTFHLHLIGQGPLVEKVLEIEDESLSVEVNPPRVSIHSSLRRSRVVVLLSQPQPNWREQVGLPIVEGLSHGCVIVCSTESGLAEWLKSRGHFVLPPDCTATELAAAICDAANNGPSYREVIASLPDDDGRIAADRWLMAISRGGCDASPAV